MNRAHRRLAIFTRLPRIAVHAHMRFFTRRTAVEMLEQTGYTVTDVRVNPDARLASTFEGKDLRTMSEVELDGLRLTGLGHQDVLELLALQLYLSATVT